MRGVVVDNGQGSGSPHLHVGLTLAVEICCGCS
jgi:hypothetical protein